MLRQPSRGPGRGSLPPKKPGGSGPGSSSGVQKSSKTQFEANASEDDVAVAGLEDEVVLTRGCRLEQLAAIIKQNSAGGQAADPTAILAGEGERAEEAEQAAIDYVSFEAAPWAKPSGGAGLAADMVEYTTNMGTSKTHGSPVGRGIVQIRIRKKYLRKGSGTEEGWLAKKSAPVTVVAWTANMPIKK